MGQHTWFVKSKELHLKQSELYRKLDAHDSGEIFLDDMELLQINYEVDEIENKNDAEYHDVFRTGKRNEDRSYIDDEIYSKEECFKWIEENADTISFKRCFWETAEQEEIYKQNAILKLNEFWDKYPDGVIYFG